MEETPSFLKNAVLVGGLVGIVTSLISIYSGYSMINSEFDGSGVPPGTYTSIITCLVGTLAGLLAIKLQSAAEIEMTLGRGALIGMVAGIAVAVFSGFTSQLWQMLHPQFAEEMVEAMMANYERIPGFSAQMADELAASTLESMTTTAGVLKSIGLGALLYGILNALSGMVGAKLFCDDPAEL